MTKFFKRKKATRRVTVEHFNHFFEYSDVSGITGRGNTFESQGVAIAGIGINKAYHYKGYKDIPAQDVPRHLSWYKNPVFAYMSLADGQLEYRYSTSGQSFMVCPATKDAKIIDMVDDFFLFFYEDTGLPEAIEHHHLKIANRHIITRDNKIAFLETYLSTDDKGFFVNQFCKGDNGIYDIAMWVDWKEDEASIVQYCIDILQDKNLSLHIDEDIEEERGLDVFITYKGVTTQAEYAPERTDRDTTLKALNKAINDDYEIRFCKEFDGDTLCFIPLTHDQWRHLEQAYPEAIHEKFEAIKETSIFFGAW